MKLFSQIYGTGPPLIILHGLFGSLDNWHSLSKRFGEHYCVFAVDQRNHGRSPHSDILTYEAMREDLREFYTDQGLSQAFLLGHSMGGKTAMGFALAFPNLVLKLVVVDIAPRAYPPHHDHLFDALCDLDLSRYHTRREVDDALGERIPSVTVRRFLMKNLKRAHDGKFSWKMNLPVIRANYDEVNHEVWDDRAFPNSALFIRALSAEYITESDEGPIRALFPKARISAFDAGHWIHAESPEPFYQTVRDFLEE
ncbi:MAG: alpha/beta fold hydrolase [Proteobacteria bacterium]|nr:alpha/beta fold hydrolase [Pseudomonadota bacterium]